MISAAANIKVSKSVSICVEEYSISVFVEPAVRDWVLDAAGGGGGVVIATVVKDPELPGASWLLRDDGDSEPIAPPPGTSADARDAAMHRFDAILDQVADAARDVLARNTSRTEEFTTPGGESWIAAQAFDGAGRQLAEVHLTGGNWYAFTADFMAWAARAAAGGRVKGAGALGPVEAFGLEELERGCALAGLSRVAG